MAIVHGKAAKIEVSADGERWTEISVRIADLQLDSPQIAEVPTPLPPLRGSVSVSVRFIVLRHVWYRYRARVCPWPATN